MTNTMILLCSIIALLIGAFAAYASWVHRKMIALEREQLKQTESIKLKLAAYERLALFAERNKLDNLVHRIGSQGMHAGNTRQLLINSIKDEFDHNVTQQLYVNPTIWDAVVRMKDQNIFIINQVGSLIAPDAPAVELNKQLLQLLAQDENTTMNKVVLDALQFEVKQLIG